MVQEVQPDSGQHQAGLVVSSAPSLEGQRRPGCFVWICNEFGEGGEGGNHFLDPETPGKKEKPSVTFCLFHLRPVAGSLLHSSPSQSTSGPAVLAGFKQQDTAPQVIPMADGRGYQASSWEGQE